MCFNIKYKQEEEKHFSKLEILLRVPNRIIFLLIQIISYLLFKLNYYFEPNYRSINICILYSRAMAFRYVEIHRVTNLTNCLNLLMYSYIPICWTYMYPYKVHVTNNALKLRRSEWTLHASLLNIFWNKRVPSCISAA